MPANARTVNPAPAPVGGLTARQNQAAVFAVVVLALIAFGLVMAYSASFADSIEGGYSPMRGMRSQFLAVLLGVAAAVAIWRMVPMRLLSGNLAYIIWGVCLVLVAYTAVWGTENYGARRWLDFGFIEFQPSEVMKIAIVIMCAKIIADYRKGELPLLHTVVMFLIAAGLPLAIILKGQSDFGTTMICAVGILTLMLLGKVSWKIIVPILVVGLVVGYYAIFGTAYRAARIETWLDPWSDPDDGGYQLIHSYYALSEGGFFCVGLGQSHEKYQYLPFAQNDFIFAVLAEESGFMGVLLMLALFLGILGPGLRIAVRCRDDRGRLVVVGILTLVFCHLYVNVAMSVGLVPITGLPLPFISAGRTREAERHSQQHKNQNRKTAHNFHSNLPKHTILNL